MPDQPFISVVIPVWRDAAALDSCLRALEATAADADVIVCGVPGEAAGYAAVLSRHPGVRWVEAPRGRGIQMNAGAAAARARWLLFLHADSRLPEDWAVAIRSADQKSDVVAGAYRLRLDSTDWQARLIERGVRLRVALFDMPYGDQGIFVRRDVFDRAAGYRDLPLMEDVALVRRLRRLGRWHHDPRYVTTSARRWAEDGWLRRSTGNLFLAMSFLAGTDPRALARRYTRRRRHAVVMMARAPWLPGKTRLAGDLTPDAHLELRRALFFDTLDAARSAGDAQCVVACEPADACAELGALLPEDVEIIPQRGADLGERLAAVFEDVFRLGHDAVVVMGSDLPDFPASRLAQALRALARRRRAVVIVPADDGGYCLIGLRARAPALFETIEWSSPRVLDQTLEQARRERLPATLLEPWRDVDDDADLRALAARAPEATGRRCRAWLEKHRDSPAA